MTPGSRGPRGRTPAFASIVAAVLVAGCGEPAARAPTLADCLRADEQVRDVEQIALEATPTGPGKLTPAEGAAPSAAGAALARQGATEGVKFTRGGQRTASNGSLVEAPLLIFEAYRLDGSDAPAKDAGSAGAAPDAGAPPAGGQRPDTEALPAVAHARRAIRAEARSSRAEPPIGDAELPQAVRALDGAVVIFSAAGPGGSVPRYELTDQLLAPLRSCLERV